jgi:Flp pilus assembly protein TadG
MGRKIKIVMQRIKFCSLARGASGAEIAETAMIIPLLFMIVLAIFWFAQAFRMYGTITQAARQGARAAVAPACSLCTPATTTIEAENAINAVNATLAAAHLSTGQIQPPVTVPALCPCPSTTAGCSGNTVACATTPITSNVCVQPEVQLSYTSLGGAGTCGTSVSFGYKNAFNFTIPFTQLNLGNLNLPAQAEMHQENQ